MIENELVLRWFWGILQATCVGLMVYSVIIWGGRIAPGTRVRLALSALLLMPALPLALWLPDQYLPRWVMTENTGMEVAGGKGIDVREGEREMETSTSTGTEMGTKDTGSNEGEAAGEGNTIWNQWLLQSTDWMAQAIDARPGGETSQQRWPISLWFAGGMMLVCVLGIARLLFGYWQLRQLRREALPCDAPRVLAMLATLRKTMGVTDEVSLQVVSVLKTPATIGWRQPAILLPGDWQQWSDLQLRAALAHELGHIVRRDSLTNLMAQAAVAINYFHPLSHLLVERLRLDQELAADSLAAPLVGGQQTYLENLAGLALRRSKVDFGGPALAFLPSRRTFLRRLEMLRTLTRSNSPWQRWLSAAAPWLVLTAAITVSVVRPVIGQQDLFGNPTPVTPQPPVAPKPPTPPTPAAVPTPPVAPATPVLSDPPQNQTKAIPGSSASGSTFGSSRLTDVNSTTGDVPGLTSYVLNPAVAVVAQIDVARLLASPGIAPITKQIPADLRIGNSLDAATVMNSVESVLLMIPRTMSPQDAAVLVRLKADAKPLSTDDAQHIVMLDPRTYLFSDNAPRLAPMMRIAPQAGQSSQSLTKLLDRHENAMVRVAWLVAPLAEKMQPPPQALMLSPLWQDTTTGSLGIDFADTIGLKLHLDSTSPKVVADTLAATRTLARNALRSAPQMTGNAGGPDAIQAAMLVAIMQQFASAALEKATITDSENQVTLELKLDGNAYTLANVLLPAVQQARTAASRMQHANNLKQIMLALHNYHDAHGHFPPAVIEENGIKRSWRVEILPYLEQAALYNAYNKNEPWDSPANQAVANMIVPVYSDPRHGKTTTGVRGIGGPHGILGSKGRKLSEILDGTSNTLCVVEVDQEVPWTQPEEFIATPENLIGHGRQENGFNAAFGDGSVRFIDNKVDRAILQAILTFDGAEVVPGF